MPKKISSRTSEKPKKTGFTGNFSIHRGVLGATGDFLSALIVELIHYRVARNDNKPVWLKLDWIQDKLPYISRSGLAKKLKKLIKTGRIIEKKGKGKFYHKCWYSLSDPMQQICTDKAMLIGRNGKVYYNWEMAKENLEASVVYAAIANLLKLDEGHYENQKTMKFIMGKDLGRKDDKLLLDYTKLSEGSGLSIGKVRKAVDWLIKNKKIHSEKVFGNKKRVWLPSDAGHGQVDLKAYLTGQLPTESYPHSDPSENEPTEKTPHLD